MIVKVCGMRDASNVEALSQLAIDMIGFIFYPKSPRFVGEVAPPTPEGVKRVGVFVNSSLSEILSRVERHKLDYVQLHSDESPAMCRELKQSGVGVVKAISISCADDLVRCAAYQGAVDYLLFDTKCSGYGGSGERFNWSLLSSYCGATPFLLSGGVDADSLSAIGAIDNPAFAGVDLNSRFEVAPAVKDIAKLENFIEKLKNLGTMNRIDNLFATKGRDILSVYYPAGYPSLDDTMPILEALEARGVDMVELGIPFSDPMADGVVIQEAATQALKGGITLTKIFEQISSMRPSIKIPVLLMGYLNPIMHYGFERFCEDCSRVGVDGLVIPDLPFKEYVTDYKSIAERYGLRVVMFISPETEEERIRLIDKTASGFIYMVSTAGTTGVGDTFGADGYFERVESMSLATPRLIGFGISNRERREVAARWSSGAIIGSHFVKLLSTSNSVEKAVERLITDIL